MTWQHVVAIVVGAGVFVAGLLTHQTGAATPVATLILGGAVGHAMPRAQP